MIFNWEQSCLLSLTSEAKNLVLGSYYWRIFLSIELPPPNPVTGNFQRNGRLNGWARNIPDFLAGICASSVRPVHLPFPSVRLSARVEPQGGQGIQRTSYPLCQGGKISIVIWDRAKDDLDPYPSLGISKPHAFIFYPLPCLNTCGVLPREGGREGMDLIVLLIIGFQVGGPPDGRTDRRAGGGGGTAVGPANRRWFDCGDGRDR